MIYSASEIAKLLNNNPLSFCQQWLSNGKRIGNYWLVGNIDNVAGNSFVVYINGKRAGKWYDNATGDKGDLLDILKYRCCDLSYAELRLMLDKNNYINRPNVIAPSEKKKHSNWISLYNRAIQNSNIRVTRYLTSRCITLTPDCLRFSPKTMIWIGEKLCYLPAILAPITDDLFNIVGLSKTFLHKTENRKADIIAPKRITGCLAGGAVRFYGKEQAIGADLIVGEGIETVLSVASAVSLPAVACLTANNLSVFHPPAEIRRLWIAHDNDTAGFRTLDNLKSKIQSCEVIPLPPLLNDHNDDLVMNNALFKERLCSMVSRAFDV